MNLFELSQNYLTLREMMLDESIDQEAIQDTIEAIEGGIEEKADNYAYIIKELDAQADMLKKEADRLSQKVTYIKNNKDRLKSNLLCAMVGTGKTKFKTDKHSFSIRKNKAVEILDENLIPEKYLAVDIKVLKTDIRNAIESGVKVKGAVIVERESLSIR
jgi:phage host-nuclease inhibitor protein Gam